MYKLEVNQMFCGMISKIATSYHETWLSAFETTQKVLAEEPFYKFQQLTSNLNSKEPEHSHGFGMYGDKLEDYQMILGFYIYKIPVVNNQKG